MMSTLGESAGGMPGEEGAPPNGNNTSSPLSSSTSPRRKKKLQAIMNDYTTKTVRVKVGNEEVVMTARELEEEMMIMEEIEEEKRKRRKTDGTLHHVYVVQKLHRCLTVRAQDAESAVERALANLEGTVEGISIAFIGYGGENERYGERDSMEREDPEWESEVLDVESVQEDDESSDDDDDKKGEDEQ